MVRISEDVSNLFGGENVVSILKALLDPEHIEVKTRVSNKAIRVLAKAKWISEREKEINKDKTSMEILVDKVVPYILELKTSIGGQSRKEITEAIRMVNKDLLIEKESAIGGMFGNK